MRTSLLKWLGGLLLVVGAGATMAQLSGVFTTAAPQEVPIVSQADEVIYAQNFNDLASNATNTTDSVADGGQLTNAGSVNSGGAGLDFATFWYDSRSEGSGPVTSSDSSDFIGVNSFTGSNSPDVAPDGTPVAANSEHNFEFNDTDGRIELVFETVDVSGFTNQSISLAYWINSTGYESDDAFYVTVSDGTNTQSFLNFGETELEGNASADDGSANWKTLTIDLADLIANSGFDATQITLIVHVDTNSSSENIFVDDVVFSGVSTPSITDPLINEFVFNHTGSDDTEYIEVRGDANTDYSAFTLLVIEGDGSGTGSIDDVFPVGTTNADGYYVTPFLNNELENGTQTILLVEGFTGTQGDDLDTDDDGTPDSAPWTRIVDDVAVDEGGIPYSSVVLVGGFDGLSFLPGGASRIPDGTDTNTTADWTRNDFDLAPIRAGSPDEGEALNTPGTANELVPPPLAEIVITEIMQNPSAVSDSNGEYFELYNAGSITVDINGWVISDNDSDSHTISNGAPLEIAPGAYLVLGNNDDTGTNGGVTVAYEYASFTLANGDDEVVLTDTSSNEIDRVEYDNGATFPDPNGASMSLCDLTADNNDGSNWAESTSTFGDGDLGTPGAANDSCGSSEPVVIVITEIMQNPSAVSDASGEYFELYNAGTTPVDLDGWVISDNDSDSHTISNGAPLEIAPGAYLVLAANDDTATNGGFTVAYEYASFTLANGADEVVLTDDGGNEIDRVEYDNGATFPDPNGASMSLCDLAADNNDGSNWAESTSTFGDGDLGTPGAANDSCGTTPIDITKIHEIQGAGLEANFLGQSVTIQGVVVGDFDDNELDGVYVQEETTDEDGNAATSEGIFVYCDGVCGNVGIGNVVTVTGTVAEAFGQTQLTNPTVTVDDANDNFTLITPAVVSFPLTAESDLEAFEGMFVQVSTPMRVTEFFNFDRFSEIRVWNDGSGTDRPFQFTQVNTPSASGFAAAEAEFRAASILLDDASSQQNIGKLFPATVSGPIFGDSSFAPGIPDGGFRGGDIIENIEGVLGFGFSNYRIHIVDLSAGAAPDGEAIGLTVTQENPRPDVPEVGGSLRVASFNVLNYFTTLNSRGATTPADLERQRNKLAQAICELDADIVGLIEIENNATEAIESLLNDSGGINTIDGCGPYGYVNTGVIGTDEIRVAFIYNTDTVSLVGNFAILDSSVDARFVDTRNRPVLAQTFQEIASGESLTVAVNHLKSKGSACDDLGDPDLGDGAGNCNQTRTDAALAMVDWLATDPTGSGDSDFLIIGDLNSYAMEDPIMAIRAGSDDTPGTMDDYTDLTNQTQGQYGYVFDGRWGTLDYALANQSLVPQVTGVAEWHLNADEPDALDYSSEFNPIAWYDGTDPFRASDHDPVIVGLDLVSAPTEGTITIVKDVIYNADIDVDSDRDFAFFSTELGNFDLDDPLTDDADGISNTAVFNSLAPGSYTIIENPNGNWNQSVLCVGDDGVSYLSPDIGATIDLDAGETVTCTFTNERVTYDLTYEKVLGDGTTAPASAWEFTLASLISPFEGTIDQDFGVVTSIPGAGGTSTLTLPLEAYKVGELVPAGYDLQQIDCGDGGVSTTPPVNDQFTIILDQDLTCIFTNVEEAPEPGSITLVKTVPVEQAPGAPGFDFVTDFAGNINNLIPTGTGSVGIPPVEVAPGTYNIEEVNIPNGWYLKDIDCTTENVVETDTSVAVTVGAGEDVTCTFFNEQRGNIIVTKDVTTGDESQVFDFLFDDGVNAPFAFPLSETGGEDGLFDALIPGTYTITETNIPAGWTLDNVICVSTGANSVINNVANGVSVELASAEDVTCTFFNSQEPAPTDGTITIVKDVIYNADIDVDSDRDFAFFSTELGNFSLDDPLTDDADGISNTAVFSSLAPGSYTIIENPNGNWNQSVLCVGDDGVSYLSPDIGATIDLDAGETVTCTFTNERVTYDLTYEKVLGDGTTAPASAWEFTLASLISPFEGTIDQDFGVVTTIPGVGGSSTLTLPLDAYSVGELVPTGYDLQQIDCGDGGVSTTPPVDDDFTIILDQDLTCVFTNVEEEPEPTTSITIVKDVIYNADIDVDSDRDFAFFSTELGNFSLDDPLTDDADGISNTAVFSSLAPGSYTIIENPNGNWNQSVLCVGDDGVSYLSPDIGATIDLDAGETVTCTFTNERVTYDLTYEKVLGDGTTAPASAWEFTLASLISPFEGTIDQDFGVVTSIPGAGGTSTLTLPLEAYKVGELVPPGYDLQQINCGDGGVSTTPPVNDQFTIILDQDLTCVFTNVEEADENLPPTIDPIPDQFNIVGDSASIPVTANDPEGLALRYEATGLPAGITIDPVSGLISGTIGETGVFSVTVTVIDSEGLTASTSFTWTVEEPTSTTPAPTTPAPTTPAPTTPAPTEPVVEIEPLEVCWIENPNGNTSAWQVTNPNASPLLPGQPDKVVFSWTVYDVEDNVLQSAERWDQTGETRINTVLADRIEVTWYLFDNELSEPIGMAVAFATEDYRCETDDAEPVPTTPAPTTPAPTTPAPTTPAPTTPAPTTPAPTEPEVAIQPLEVCWIEDPNGNTSAWQVTNPNPAPLYAGQPDKVMFGWEVFDEAGNVLQSAERWDQTGETRINTVLASYIQVTWYYFDNSLSEPMGTTMAFSVEEDRCEP